MSTFANFVGQETVKRKLRFHLRAYKASRIVPHLMFVAPRGYGKTMLAVEFAKLLESKDRIGEAKKILIINCSTIKSVSAFFDNLILPYGLHGDKETTFIFDECSEIPTCVTMSLLTILNPNKENKNKYLYKGSNLIFDFSKQTFLFATTEPQKVYHAMMDRTRRIDFEDYSSPELAEIMRGVLDKYQINKDLLEVIAESVRSNGRQAVAMANDISNYLKGFKKDSFIEQDWSKLCSELSVKPLGLNDIEIRLMRVLKDRGEVKLTCLASILNMTKESIQYDVETYLQKRNLIHTTTMGRTLTSKGRNYMEALDETL